MDKHNASSVQITLIGVGQAGGRLADTFLDVDDWLVRDPVAGTCAIDTSRAHLQNLSAVPDAQRYLMGTDRAKGHGVGLDNELAATIAVEERARIRDIIDGLPIAESDAVLTLAGLGGGTGSGMTPAIAETVRNEYDIPVYGLGILPHSRTSPIQTLNAARSLRSLRQQTSHVFLFDNDAWGEADPDEELYRELNERVATALGTLFGVVDHVDTESTEETQTATEYSAGVLSNNALSAIGFATEPADHIAPAERNQGLFSRLWPTSPGETGPNSTAADESDPSVRSKQIEEILSEATSPPYTLSVDPDKDREVGLFVIAPKSYLSETDLREQELTTVDRLDPTHLHAYEPSSAGTCSRVSAVCLLTDDCFDPVAELIEQAITLQNDPSWIEELEVSDQFPDLLEERPTDTEATTADGNEDLEPLF
ncbi:tubulin/FtsZ family protein [Halorubrum luteum]